MADFPQSTTLSTDNVNQDTDYIGEARAEIEAGIDTTQDIIDSYDDPNGIAPLDANRKLPVANLPDSVVETTDLSVVIASAAAGGGSLSYANGVFTYTPASTTGPGYTVSTAATASGGGGLSLVGNVFTFTPADIPTLPTDILRSATAMLSSLSNVSNATPTQGQALVYNATSSMWEPMNVSSGAATLGALDDVSITGLTNNKVLQYNAASRSWQAADLPADAVGATTLGGLTDVDDSAPADDQVLQYSSSNSRWEPSTVIGQRGERGEQGLPGRDGRDGTDGTNGTNGTNGDQGAPGRDGTDGAPGQRGQQGERGEQGLQGLQGIQGTPGTNGTDGAPGQRGERGLPGQDGTDGAPGRDGTDGTNGTDGAPGRDGADGATTLNDLTDVNASNPQVDQILRYGGSGFVLTRPTIGLMSDVNSRTPTNGQVLKWNSTASNWEPEDDNTGSGGTSNIRALTDVSNTAPTDNQILRYDSASNTYIPEDLPTSSGGGGASLPADGRAGEVLGTNFAETGQTWISLEDIARKMGRAENEQERGDDLDFNEFSLFFDSSVSHTESVAGVKEIRIKVAEDHMDRDTPATGQIRVGETVWNYTSYSKADNQISSRGTFETWDYLRFIVSSQTSGSLPQYDRIHDVVWTRNSTSYAGAADAITRQTTSTPSGRNFNLLFPSGTSTSNQRASTVTAIRVGSTTFSNAPSARGFLKFGSTTFWYNNRVLSGSTYTFSPRTNGSFGVLPPLNDRTSFDSGARLEFNSLGNSGFLSQAATPTAADQISFVSSNGTFGGVTIIRVGIGTRQIDQLPSSGNIEFTGSFSTSVWAYTALSTQGSGSGRYLEFTIDSSSNSATDQVSSEYSLGYPLMRIN